MPQQAWSKKRERQYEHIKEGLEDRGRSEDVAEEIAARTVNKERARNGEAGRAAKPRPMTSPPRVAAGCVPTQARRAGRGISSTTRRGRRTSRAVRR
jgi:plasmid stabilization system protein ParE